MEIETDLGKRIGRNIHLLCYDKSIKQKDLAEAAGVSEKAISKAVSGEAMLSVAKLHAVANKLGVTIDALINGGT